MEGKPLGKFEIAHDERTADDITVPAEVLGRRVHHHVGTQQQRLLQVGGGECVVDDQESSGVVSDVGDRGDIRDVQQRIGRGFDPDQPRSTWLYGRGDGIEVGHGGGRVVDSPGRCHLREEAIGPAIGVVGDNRVSTRGQDGAHQRVLGGESRGESQTAGIGVFRRLERGKAFLECGARGVRAPGVLVSVA